MANSVVTVTVVDEMPLPGKGYLVHGTLAIEASPGAYATGGLALGVAEFAAKLGISGGQSPKLLVAQGVAGYYYEYDVANKKLRIRTGAAAQTVLTELTAAATPAGVSGDTIHFLALFDKNS